MWVDVFTNIDARKTPMKRLIKPQPEDYELRFIAYKVSGIPLGDRPVIDIYLQAQFDPGGW
jgi:hypothetical protein